MVRKKVQIPNVVRGGIAIPLNKDNMFLMKGRKHSQGGIDIGNNPRTGMEVEDGEVVQMTNNGAKIFSTMPFLNGQSPANKVLNGQNPNEVFKHQENFKKRNNINNDGTYSRGENLGFGNTTAQEEFGDGGFKPDLIQEKDNTRIGNINTNDRQRTIPYGAGNIDRSPLAILDAIDNYGKSNNPYMNSGTAPIPSFANKYTMLKTVTGVRKAMTLKNIKQGIRPVSSLPTNNVYRVTNMREIKDAQNVGIFRKMPPSDDIKPVKIGKFIIGGPGVRDHGGKAAVAGKPWGASVHGNVGEKEYIMSIPGRRTRWKTGYNGRYSKSYKKFNEIPTGKPIFNKFDADGNTPIKTDKLKVYEYIQPKIVKLKKPWEYKAGGYRSSNNIRRRIAKMEGSSMKTNRAFDLEDRDFYNAIPGNVRSKLNQDALDNLYSYSYNVGAGAFKRRVVPALTALTNGTGTVKAVQDSMYASKDKQLRGLRIRRNIEKQGFADAYNRYNNINNTLANTQNMIDNIQEKVEPPVVEQDNTYVQKPIEIKGIEMPKKQKRYNSELIKLGMNMLNNKVKYSSTFAAGGRKNTSTGKYLQTFAAGGQQKKKPINRIKQFKDWLYNKYSSPTNVKNNNAINVRINDRNKSIPQDFNRGTLPKITGVYKRKNKNINNINNSSVNKPINKHKIVYRTMDGRIFNDENEARQYNRNYYQQLKAKQSVAAHAPKAAPAPKAAHAPKANQNAAYQSTSVEPQTAVQNKPVVSNSSTAHNTNNSSTQTVNHTNSTNRPIKKQVKRNTNKSNTTKPVSNASQSTQTTNYKPYVDTTTQKKIDELNKMKKDNAEFDRKYNALSKSEQLYVHAGKDKNDINKRLNDSYYKHPNNYIVNKNSISPFARNNDNFDIKTDAANLSNKVNRDLRRQAISEYNRRQINKSDAIGLASNVLGSVASGMINDRMLSSMKYPSAPVRTTAAKLKTNYNINPQLDALRENLYDAYQSINDSTNSSQLALARRQRYAFNNTLAANGLYGNKENQQAQLINQDRLNQQQNSANNVAAYNQWNQNKATFDNSIAEKRAENSVGILQNINAGVQDVLARREQRQHDNNTIKAMFAANPNVTPEYFSHYGLNLYRFGGKRFNRR